MELEHIQKLILQEAFSYYDSDTYTSREMVIDRMERAGYEIGPRDVLMDIIRQHEEVVRELIGAERL